MSLLKTLTLLATLAIANASVIQRRDNSTCNVALSSSTQCTTTSSGAPGSLSQNVCYDVTAGIQSFEFYETPEEYKDVTIYEEAGCAEGKTATYTPEIQGCVELGFVGKSVKYTLSG